MKINYKKCLSTAIYVLVVLAYPISAIAELVPLTPLDSGQHPISPELRAVGFSTPLSLDTRLSWVKRFNGNETFNSDEVLPNSPLLASELKEIEVDKMEMLDSPMTQSQTKSMDAQGVVKGLRMEDGKVKISHGPIDKLGMPAMTMVFKVENMDQLLMLKKGQSVNFNIDNTSGGFVISEIEASVSDRSDATGNLITDLDAKGVVRSIKINQSKIKIKHGPISKYGMPAMTMVFKVSEPGQLAKLKKGSEVRFDVENTSGGFVITNIQSVEE